MFTGITRHVGALVTAVVVLTGAAILRCGAAAADPNQDDQFLALLDQEQIPAVDNVPSVIAAGHKVCRKLDNGTPVDDIVDAMRNDAYNIDPIVRRHPVRVTSTVTRFITAAVEAYCPYDQSKIASMAANPVRGSNESTHRVAAYWPNAVNSGSDLRESPSALGAINVPSGWQELTGTGAVRPPHLVDGGVFVVGRHGDVRSDGDTDGAVLASLIQVVPSGEITPPNLPQIPAPSPPTAQVRTPPRTIAAPPPLQAPAPPPEQAPPPPQELPSAPEQAPPPPEQAPPPEEPPPPAQQPPFAPEQAPFPPQQLEPPAAPQPGGTAGSGGSRSGGGNGRGDPAEPSPRMPPGFVRLAP